MLSSEDVKHIAELAKFTLTEEEVKKFGEELDKTLDYIRVLDELPTEGVEPTSQVTGLLDVFRPDKKENGCFSQKEVLAPAKNTRNGRFKVDFVFDES